MSKEMTNKGKEKQYLFKHADAYEKSKGGYFNTLNKVLLLCESEQSGKHRCLDIGSGMGLFLIAMHQKGLEAYGVEPQAELIEFAQENCNLMGFTSDIREGFSEAIPFPDDFFDLIISNSVMEHVQDWEVSSAECIRCLKPGGVLYVMTTNRQHPRQWEVNDFPFFSWLPHRVQRRYMKYCLEHRPDKINYTPIPVRFFFTHRQMIRKFRELGATSYDRYDLFNPEWFSGKKAILKPFAQLFRRGWFKWILYFPTPMTTLYAVKGFDQKNSPSAEI